MPRLELAVALAALVSAGFAAAPQGLSQRDAENLARKLTLVVERGSKPPAQASRPVRTPVSEQEVNAYFKYQGKDFLPVGVVDPNLSILDATRVEARAAVDLDAVRTAKERHWSDPLSWVTGTVEVRAKGLLKAANGRGSFLLESATLGGVPIPKTLLQELIAYYSRTADSPNGFNLDAPFALPHQIRQVELQRGSAVIVQ
jgi:hypothetical protein